MSARRAPIASCSNGESHQRELFDDSVLHQFRAGRDSNRADAAAPESNNQLHLEYCFGPFTGIAVHKSCT
jgi:hypothetical protein